MPPKQNWTTEQIQMFRNKDKQIAILACIKALSTKYIDADDDELYAKAKVLALKLETDYPTDTDIIKDRMLKKMKEETGTPDNQPLGV